MKKILALQELIQAIKIVMLERQVDLETKKAEDWKKKYDNKCNIF